MSHFNGERQLRVFEILTRRKVSSRVIREELTFKIGKRDARTEQLKKLDQFACLNRDLEIEVDEGVWVARPIGKTNTGFYLWNLLLRPVDQAVA